jgi:dipeptidase E
MTMNRLDARARLVFHYAREEADRLGHAVIESEHLLLGLLREGGTAAVVLNASGLTLEAARHRVVELIGRFERSRDAPPPAITALARRVMDLAGVEAANYQSSFINTGFVLLGMIHAGDGVAMGIINQTSGGTKAVRKATLAALNLPPDTVQDAEETSPSSSLSGIVAVPADSVLARLFNRPPEQNLVPSSQTMPELSSQTMPELSSQTMPEFPTSNDSETKSISLENPKLEPVNHQRLEAVNSEIINAQLETPTEEIPDSMLIDEAFEEVPPEIEEISQVQVLETTASVIDQEPIEGFNQVTAIRELETITAFPELETVSTFPEFEEITQVKHPTPVIEADLNSQIETQLEADLIDPLAKVTAEVLVSEVEVMPESILQPEKPSFEPSPNDSTEGLLISDLPETPFDQDTTLVSYQTPVLVVLSEPQVNLELPKNQNLEVQDSNQTENFIDLESEMPEPTKPTLAWLESDNSEEPTETIQEFAPDLVISSSEPEILVIPAPLIIPEVQVEPLAEIALPTPLLEESTPIIGDLTFEAVLEPSTFEAVLEPSVLEAVLEQELQTIEPLIETPNTEQSITPTLLKVASWDMVTASSVIKRQIIALGGGGFSQEPSNLLLDQYILETASSAREVAVPRVCFVSTAAGDSDVYIKRFYKAFEQLNCQASHLPLFHTDDWAEDLEDMILSADVLYFSGGSTKNALALWQAWELEPIFKQAYEAGTVFTGVSAGAICWFEQFTTDSMGRSLGVMSGLGWLPGSFTPHYDSERFRKPTLEKFLRAQKISPGFAADDHAAVHFVNGEYIGAVASTATAKAYHVTLGRNRLVESPLETRFLG